MNQRDPEYDRFGPWVVEIGDEDPVPPLFVPHVARSEPALLSLKIPRRISRREAHPGMDLYDYLVSLYEDDLVVLQRVGHEVETHTTRYDDISYLCLREELLRGSVHLGVAGRHYDLPFNSVSGDIMRRLVDLVRDRYLTRPEPLAIEIEPVAIAELSFYFERLLSEELAGDNGTRPVATQSGVALGALEENLVRRLLIGIVAKRLLESLHLSDGRELTIIDRGQPYAYRWQSVYGRAETWIPLANITATQWDWGPEEGGMDPVTLVIRTAAGDLSWVFTPNNAALGAYRRFLTAVSAITRP